MPHYQNYNLLDNGRNYLIPETYESVIKACSYILTSVQRGCILVSRNILPMQALLTQSRFKTAMPVFTVIRKIIFLCEKYLKKVFFITFLNHTILRS